MWAKQNRSTKPMTRPVKSLCERKRRLKMQKKRLMTLGVPEAAISLMNTRQIKDLLKMPAEVAGMSAQFARMLAKKPVKPAKQAAKPVKKAAKADKK